MAAVGPWPETPDSDQSLLARVASGDQPAFESLFLRYQKRLLRFLLGMVRSEEIAQELLCEMMVDVWRNAHTFQGRSRVSTWIFGIASNKAKTALRRRQPVEADPEVLERLIDPTPGSADAMVQRELAEQVQAAIELLPPEHRQVVELTFMHGFSYREIAEIVGCPVNTVKTRMFHAKRRLREALSAIFSQELT